MPWYFLSAAARTILIGAAALMLLTACSTGRFLGGTEKRVMEATAYCPCGECNGYTRGSWKMLKADQWNRYVKSTGRKYTGKTASGGTLQTPRAGPLPRDGTIAADTNYYPFGTRMYVPGWGWGVVSDRGGAIKGPNRIDLLHSTHSAALKWGRRNVEVTIIRK